MPERVTIGCYEVGGGGGGVGGVCSDGVDKGVEGMVSRRSAMGKVSRLSSKNWDVSEGKCSSLKGEKPKTVDNEECECSKQGSRKGDDMKAVNGILSKAVKER
uniref:Uncharacterized protein n=1 Tax=Tanacetum cinerariifolium TaxID=118510 RepID=A0A6L2LFX4_TANCI|nr:hypothetical protein [Tanacetum cinerariifolium]